MRFLSLKLLVLITAFLAPAARDTAPVENDSCSLWPKPDQANADDGANSYRREYRINTESDAFEVFTPGTLAPE